MSIILNTCTNIQGVDGKEFSYPEGINGQQLLEQALTNLGIPVSGQYRALALRKGSTLTWIDPKKNIVHYHLKDKSNLYLLKEKQPLSVETTSGAKKKLLLDITQKCSVLVKFIAEKFKIEPNGYAIFTVDKDGVQHPTDLDLTLPQQSTEYENIFFKRRYYCYLKSQVQDKAGALFIYTDVKSHLMQAKPTVTHEQGFEMAYLSLYATANSADEVKANASAADINSLFPYCAPEEGDLQKIVAKVNNEPPLSREDAVSKYLAIAHQLPGFGCETTKTKFAPIVDKVRSDERQDGTITVGPKSIIVKNANGDEYMSAPWFRFTSCKLHSSTVDVKYMDRKGAEAEISLKVKKPFDLYTLISGYASITHELGAQLLTDGFFTDNESNGVSTIDPAVFQLYIKEDINGNYTYYPGTLDDFKKLFEDIDVITRYYPDISREMKALLENIEKGSYDVYSTIKLVKLVHELLEDPTAPDHLRIQVVKAASATISTLNIIPSKIDGLIHGIQNLIEHQKLIRVETMTKLEAARKKKLTTWLEILNEHLMKFQEFSGLLKKCPANGEVLRATSKQLLFLTADLPQLTKFIQSISDLAPDNSYIAAIEHFKLKLTRVASPLLPNLPDSAIPHIKALHIALFYTAVSIALIHRSLKEPSIANNSELLETITKSTDAIHANFCLANVQRLDLNRRPFSLIIVPKIVDFLTELKNSLFIAKPHVDMVAEISGMQVYSQGLTYATTQIDNALSEFSKLNINPYRIIPSQEVIQSTVDMLEEISTKLNEACKSTDANPDFLFKLNNTTQSLSNIALTLKVTQITRGTIGTIAKINDQTKWLLQNLQEITRILGNASIIHHINKLLNHCDGILSLHSPTFDEYVALLKEVGELANTLNVTEVLTEVERIEKSHNFDLHTTSLYKILTWAKEVANYNNPGQDVLKLANTVLQTTDCGWQVPLNDKYPVQPLILFPFFQGKDPMRMTTELIQQISDFQRYLTDFHTVPLINENKILDDDVEHWVKFFKLMTSVVENAQAHEHQLIKRLKEIIRKSPQFKLFAHNVIPYLSENKFLEMIDVFFSNCELIITKLKQPHIGKTAAARFSEKIAPLLNLAEVAISRILTSGQEINKDLAEKLKSLKQLISHKMSDAQSSDTNKQQELADELYALLTQIVPEARRNPELTELSTQLNHLKAQISDYTATGLMKSGTSGNMSSSAFFAPTIDSDELADILKKFMNNQTDIKQLQDTYNMLTSEGEFADQAGTYTANVLTKIQIKNKISEAIRLLIYTQDNEQQKTEQLKNLNLHLFQLMANRIKEIAEIAKNVDVNRWSTKSRFYMTLLNHVLKGLDTDILTQHPTLNSLSMIFRPLREFRNLLSLMQTVDIDDEIKCYSEDFVVLADNADIAIKLYFFHHCENIIKHLKAVGEINEKASQLAEKFKPAEQILKDESIILRNDWVKLSVLAQGLIEHEEELEQVIKEAENDHNLQRLQSDLRSIGEIRFIIKNWANITRKFDETDFRVNILSNLALIKAQTKKIESTLGDDVMSVPYVTSLPISYISAILEEIKFAGEHFSEQKELTDKIQSLYDNISKDVVQLYSADDAYLADLDLQQSIPELFSNLTKLQEVVEEFKKPDYSLVPTLTLKEIPHRLDVIKVSVEKTEFAKFAADVCESVRKEIETLDCNNEENIEKMRKLVSNVEQIPSVTFTPLADAKKELHTLIDQVVVGGESLEAAFPRFVAVLVKVMPNIPEHTAQKLDVCPEKFVVNQTTAVNSSKLLKDYINFMESDSETIKSMITQSTVKIIDALDTENATEIHKTMQEFIALNCAVIDRNEKSDLLSGIIDNFSTFQDGVESAVNSQTDKLDEKTTAAVYEMKRKFIQMITGATMELAETIQKSENIDSILDVRNLNNLSARTLVGQIDPSKAESRKHLLFVASNMQLLSQRGLEVSQATPLTFYREYVSLFDQSLLTLKTILGDNAQEQRKGLRIFKRVVDNIGDLNDDISLEISSSQLSPFEEHIRQLFRSCTEIEAAIAMINAAYATAKIPQSFTLILNEQSPRVKDLLVQMKERADTLLKANTFVEINESFNIQLDDVATEVENLLKVEPNVEITDLVSLERKISSGIEVIASTALQMTDEIKLKYDPDNSARLPNKFALPGFPDLAEEDKIKTVREEILESKEKIDAAHEILSKLAEQTNPDHTKLADATLDMEANIEKFIVSTFKLSMLSSNIQMQSNLTSSASRLAALGNAVNHSARSLFLAMPTWNNNVHNDLTGIITETNIVISLADKALENAEVEEQKREARKAKFFDALKPIQDASQKAKDAIQALEGHNDEMFKAMATNMLNIALAGCHVVSTVLLKAKDNESTTTSPDQMCEMAQKVADAVIKAAEAANTQSIVDVTTPFSEAMDEFKGTIAANNSATQNMSSSIVQVSEGARTLQSTIKRAMSTANTTKKVAAQMKTPEERAKMQEQLMTRLELESAVHRNRWWYEHSEKILASFEA